MRARYVRLSSKKAHELSALKNVPIRFTQSPQSLGSKRQAKLDLPTRCGVILSQPDRRIEERSREGRSVSRSQANSRRAAQSPAAQQRRDCKHPRSTALKGFTLVGAVRGVWVGGVAGRSSLGSAQPIRCSAERRLMRHSGQRPGCLRFRLRRVDLAHDSPGDPGGVSGGLPSWSCAQAAQRFGLFGPTSTQASGQRRSGAAGSLAALHLSQAKKKPLIRVPRCFSPTRPAFGKTPLCIRLGPGVGVSRAFLRPASATPRKYLVRWIFADPARISSRAKRCSMARPTLHFLIVWLTSTVAKRSFWFMTMRPTTTPPKSKSGWDTMSTAFIWSHCQSTALI